MIVVKFFAETAVIIGMILLGLVVANVVVKLIKLHEAADRQREKEEEEP